MSVKTYPRKYADKPATTADTSIKATKKGAIHWVGTPGTGGFARKVNRRKANEG